MDQFQYARTYRGRVQAVIFDWAGTMVDYGCLAPAAVFIEVFKRQGVDITVEEAREPMGAHKMDHIREVTQMPSVAKRWKEANGKLPNETDVEAMFEEFVPRQVDCIAEYADMIPGALDVVASLRKREIKIGSTTGYTGEMMKVLVPEAKKRGYAPDSIVCATDVPYGRPKPWMCFANAQNLGVFPMEAVVKVGDTLSDIAEGLNAGMWTIGVTKCGNELGLSEKEADALDSEELHRRLDRASQRMYQAGAHFVVESIGDILPCIDEVEARLRRGERP
jgi:phosphonoacetaldehyde hydrolase